MIFFQNLLIIALKDTQHDPSSFNMTNYIIPQIIKYQNIDDLLENNNQTRSLFDSGENLSLDKLLQENFVCIVGEPGIGKSRLVEEIKKHFSKKQTYTMAPAKQKTGISAFWIIVGITSFISLVSILAMFFAAKFL